MARKTCEHCGSMHRTTAVTLLEGIGKELVVSTCVNCGRELYRAKRTPLPPAADIRWDFFDAWTPELAWWLGVFYGDGNIYVDGNTHRVQVVGSETTGRRWLDLVAPGKTPKVIHKGTTDAVQAYKDSRHLVQLMEDKFGFTPGPKTFDLKWPEDLPVECLPHFVRGLWDSDGSLYIENRRRLGNKGNDSVVAKYGSVCHPFVERLREEIVRATGVSYVHIEESIKSDSTAPMYVIKWRGKSAMDIAHRLYRDAPEHLRNEDRQEKYKELCALRYDIATAKCHCGEPATHEEFCALHWWDGKRTTGPEVACKECGKKGVEAKGMCVGCYKKHRRSLRETHEASPSGETGFENGPSVECRLCGCMGTRSRGFCNVCYQRVRRAERKGLTFEDVKNAPKKVRKAPSGKAVRKEGACSTCGAEGVFSKQMCQACYFKARRARLRAQETS